MGFWTIMDSAFDNDLEFDNWDIDAINLQIVTGGMYEFIRAMLGN